MGLPCSRQGFVVAAMLLVVGMGIQPAVRPLRKVEGAGFTRHLIAGRRRIDAEGDPVRVFFPSALRLAAFVQGPEKAAVLLVPQ